mmetsp:Transcript_4306/g.10415  ORF Transcript_4306/g.10415 Transcript_4306/m.10415 type:complete len:167 (+) Transcript_4306:287-787(+)
MTCVFIHNAHHVYMTFIYYMCLCFVCRRCCCCCCLSACLSVCLCAQQLMKYEANNDTTDLSAMDRCAKMLKRKVTAKVAGLVEAAAAAAAVAAAGTAEDSLPADPDYATRAVTTAGDALLIYLVCCFECAPCVPMGHTRILSCAPCVAAAVLPHSLGQFFFLIYSQ